MTAAAGARLQTWRSEPAVTLATSELEATFLPSLSMLGVSLRHRGDELLAPIAPLDRYRAGHVTGIPLLYPWANRLRGWSYDAQGKHVNVARDVPVDPQGLPIHGTVAGIPFDVVHLDGTRLHTRLDATSTDAIMRSFPFPHELGLDVSLTNETLTITTTVHATGDSAVPISFGFHPYFRLPRARRAEWRLRLPRRDRLTLDAHQLPTDDTTPEPEDDRAIGNRTFDDLYALAGDRNFELATHDRRLTVTFDDGFPYAQVYAPPRTQFACIEPMTAPVNALVDGTAPAVAPGDSFQATWQVEATT
jgi:aldose 1-epimerase